MANPPDNNLPGNSDKPDDIKLNKPDDTDRQVNRGVGGKPANPDLTPDDPPPVPTSRTTTGTTTRVNTNSQSADVPPVPPANTTMPKVPDAANTAASGVAAAAGAVGTTAGAVGAAATGAADSAATTTRNLVKPGSHGSTPPVDTTNKLSNDDPTVPLDRSEFERPPSGKKPAKAKTSLTRSAAIPDASPKAKRTVSRNLERPVAQGRRNPDAPRRPEARPERGRRPDHRPERGHRRDPQYRERRPVQSRPRRRMAPPPGAKQGRYVAPAPGRRRPGYVIPPDRAAKTGAAIWPLLFGLLLLLGVLWYAITRYAPMLNADLVERSNESLDGAGFGDTATVDIDGRTAILSGNVATQSDSDSAEEAVANTSGVRAVDNQLVIGGDATASGDAEDRTTPSLAFATTDDSVTLSGTVSDQQYADRIESSAKELYGEANVSGSIDVDPNSTNPGWWPAVEELTPDLQNIENGSFDVQGDTLVLTGSTVDQTTKDDLGAKAEALLEGQLTVDNQITIAEPAPSLKRAFATLHNSADKVVLYGGMPEESAASLESALADAGKPVQNDINVSDEFEAPEWLEGLGSSFAAMQDIRNGKVNVTDTGALVITGIATSEEAKQLAEDNVVTLLGTGIDNRIVVRVPEPEAVAPFMEPFASIADNGSEVQLDGMLPADAAEALIAAYEQSGKTVNSNLTVDERVIAPEWTDAATQSLAALEGIENPRVNIASNNVLTISGLAETEADKERAANNAFDTFGNSVSLLNEITVKAIDINALFAQIDLAAIRFQTNSSELDADSIGILDQVADALRQAPNVQVAIEGHTDSTGNNDRNIVLSGERATRVQSFLIERGISGDRLSATGYGSSQPKASNDTAAGRAQNRRIEFVLN